MKKKKLFSLAVIVICLSIIGGGTLAYFTDSTTAHNVITTGNIDIEIIETTDGENPFVDVTGVMPGMEVDKIVQVSNEGANDAWVRLKVDKQITLANGTVNEEDENLIIRYNLGDAPEQWTYAQDNENQNYYYYYNSLLKPGQKTTPLFKDVLFDKKMGNEYQNSTAQVYVFAQATQGDNNGKTVLEADGWPQ